MEIWIIGAGRFGRLALKRLPESHPGASFTVVDLEEQRGLPEGVEVVRGDAARFLFENLDDSVRWIIPAVPVHLAFEVLLLELGPCGSRVPVPREVPEMLLGMGVPSVSYSGEGSLLVSMAKTTCPDDCTEPPGLCPATGETRKRSLFGILEDIHIPGWPISVLRSRQLGPGVGGFGPGDLLGLRGAIPEAGNALIATACRCHGVISGLKRLAIP